MTSRFASSSALRKFEIRLKDGSLFVNSHYMAEISPYFHHVCFSEDFSEAQNGVVVIDDMDYSEVLATLEFLCPDRNYELKKYITDNNLASLIMCSRRFIIPSLTTEIKHFLEVEIEKPEIHLKPETLVDAILECEFAGYNYIFLRGIYRKIASHGEEAVQLALKDLPSDIASRLMVEISPHLRMLNPLRVRYQSSYHWNDSGSKRMWE